MEAQTIIDHSSELVAAIAALGTAAYGLVDSTKAFAGGMSNPGFGYIRAALEPFLPPSSPSGFGRDAMLATLRANWLNGVTKAEQKATARSLARLALLRADSALIAGATGLDETQLRAMVTRIAAGEELDALQMTLLGQFDAIVAAVVDSAYERADQFYRNATKAGAALVAMGLALAGGYLLDGARGLAYLGSGSSGLAFLVGAIAVPIAPIAKDLTSTLSAAVAAVASLKRR